MEQKTTLDRHRVVIADIGKRRDVGIGRRGRQTIAEQVRDDDEIAIGIQRAATLDQPFGVVVLRAERSRVDNHVVLPRIQRAVSLVGEPHGTEDGA